MRRMPVKLNGAVFGDLHFFFFLRCSRIYFFAFLREKKSCSTADLFKFFYHGSSTGGVHVWGLCAVALEAVHSRKRKTWTSSCFRAFEHASTERQRWDPSIFRSFFRLLRGSRVQHTPCQYLDFVDVVFGIEDLQTCRPHAGLFTVFSSEMTMKDRPSIAAV